MAYGGAVTRDRDQSESATGPVVLGLPGVRVRTLLTIRWIAIIGQLVTLIIVGVVLNYPLSVWPILAALAASVAVNVGSMLLHPAKAYLTGREATVHLAFDLLQLAVLLYLTGGLTNPFSMLILVPVTISATLLSLRNTVFLFLLGTACLSALSVSHLPLPWPGEPLTLPVVYRVGQWAALVLGMAFLTAYAWQVSAEGRRRQLALVATQTALAREQKMSALGSLAAAAAHELGGPLGTITLIARELDDQLGNDPDFGSDVGLLKAEAARCREILVGIARRAEAEQPFPALPLDTLMHEVFQPFEGRNINLSINFTNKTKDERPLTVARSPELMHGLANLVSNAVRHAATMVTADITEDRDLVCVRIRDDGDGFDPVLLPRLGEPYLGPSQSFSGGTGLGIFIATTLLERTGATLSFTNRDEGGAQVEICWPRRTFSAEEIRP